jgi:casein kinase II subunit alpha
MGLAHAHALGIIHRDIKPENLLFIEGNLKIIDWGLAEIVQPGKRMNTRVCSLNYKSPEILLGNNFYDQGLDIWSAGCILASLLFKKNPFFAG